MSVKACHRGRVMARIVQRLGMPIYQRIGASNRLVGWQIASVDAISRQGLWFSHWYRVGWRPCPYRDALERPPWASGSGRP